MNSTAKTFSFFDQQFWHDLFKAVAPNWKMLSPTKVSGLLLDKVYNMTITEAFDKLKTEMGRKLGIDGATDNLAKSKSNLILHNPFPIFIE